MENTALEYAESVSAGFWSDYSDGAVFGWVCEDSGELTEDHGEDCGEDCDEHRPAYASEWLTDVLDIRYVIGSDMGYRNAEIAITLGGPNVWIMTETATVHVYWGGDHVIKSIPRGMSDALDEALDEYYEMSR